MSLLGPFSLLREFSQRCSTRSVSRLSPAPPDERGKNTPAFPNYTQVVTDGRGKPEGTQPCHGVRYLPLSASVSSLFDEWVVSLTFTTFLCFDLHHEVHLLKIRHFSEQAKTLAEFAKREQKFAKESKHWHRRCYNCDRASPKHFCVTF